MFYSWVEIDLSYQDACAAAIFRRASSASHEANSAAIAGSPAGSRFLAWSTSFFKRSCRSRSLAGVLIAFLVIHPGDTFSAKLWAEPAMNASVSFAV